MSPEESSEGEFSRKKIENLKRELGITLDDEALNILKKRLQIEQEIKTSIALREFKVSDYLSLQLVENLYDDKYCQRTIIYIKEKPLILIFPDMILPSLYAEKYHMEEHLMGTSPKRDYDWKNKPPIQAFELHCSRISSWINNDFNTDILHIDLAFFLLLMLVDLVDLSNNVLKREMMHRFESGVKYEMEYLEKTQFLDLLSKEEMSSSVKRVVQKKIQEDDMEFVMWTLSKFYRLTSLKREDFFLILIEKPDVKVVFELEDISTNNCEIIDYRYKGKYYMVEVDDIFDEIPSNNILIGVVDKHITSIIVYNKKMKILPESLLKLEFIENLRLINCNDLRKKSEILLQQLEEKGIRVIFK